MRAEDLDCLRCGRIYSGYFAYADSEKCLFSHDDDTLEDILNYPNEDKRKKAYLEKERIQLSKIAINSQEKKKNDKKRI